MADEIFAPKASIKERFPNHQDGLELVEAIFEIYALSRSAVLTYWDASRNTKLIVQHDVNKRKQQQILRKYVPWQCLGIDDHQSQTIQRTVASYQTAYTNE